MLEGGKFLLCSATYHAQDVQKIDFTTNINFRENCRQMRNLVRKMQRFVKLHGGTRMFLETIMIRSRSRVPRYGHESSIKPKMNSHQVRGRLIFPVGYCFLWWIGWTSREEIKKKEKGNRTKKRGASTIRYTFNTLLNKGQYADVLFSEKP